MLKIIAAVALLATTAPAIAQAETAPPQVHVSYADLDLRNAAGVQQLDRRLRSAVKAVCADDGAIGRLIPLEVARCRKAAFASLADQRATALAAANAHVVLALNTDVR